MAAVFPFVKILHEFGHGIAVKRFGGDVHEMGVLILALYPVPYLDATRANAFPNKWSRVLVGSAGVLTELAIASIAMLVWASVDHGLTRSIAYNVIVIASVSTLIVNGNPLLRFDGYYVMMDLIEVPNFGSRSVRYYGYLIQRYLFGSRHATSPVQGPRERFWFIVYGPMSFVYRWVVVISLILVVGAKYFIAGILIAAWACVTSIVIPLTNTAKMLVKSPMLAQRRGSAFAVSAALFATAVVLVGVVPLPRHRVVEGVLYVSESHWVRTSGEGQFEHFTARPDAMVSPGDLLFTLQNDQLPVNVAKARAVLSEARVRRDAAWDAPSEYVAATEVAMHAQRSLTVEESKLSELAVRAPQAGQFLLEERHLDGRYLTKGMLVGYVVDPSQLIVRAIVPQESAGEVRDDCERVELRFVDRFDRVLTSEILREVPAASDRLPSPTLATIGGGHVALKPEDRKSLTAFDRYFQFDLKLPAEGVVPRIGTRVHVRFVLKPEALAFRLYRRVRHYAREHFKL
jgi:putative peptide zinc metalloprotease protein